MSWINRISNGIEEAFKFARPALTMSVPPLLLLCEIKSRPGLSAIALASSIIRRLPEAGIYTGVNPDGSPNMILAKERISAEEIVKEFKDNCKVTCVIPSGVINFIGNGGGPTGPVTVTGTNTIPITINGIIE